MHTTRQSLESIVIGIKNRKHLLKEMEGFYWFLENIVDYFCDTKHDALNMTQLMETVSPYSLV